MIVTAYINVFSIYILYVTVYIHTRTINTKRNKNNNCLGDNLEHVPLITQSHQNYHHHQPTIIQTSVNATLTAIPNKAVNLNNNNLSDQHTLTPLPVFTSNTPAQTMRSRLNQYQVTSNNYHTITNSMIVIDTNGTASTKKVSKQTKKKKKDMAAI